VADHGCGIAAEHVAKVFDPFFTTKDVDKGTGLGLAISHGIVERHRGRIEVESEPGVGSTFRVVLPAHVPPQHA
jgi:two-component system NtrC family sensor kinase